MSEQQNSGLTTDISMKFRIRGGKTVMVLPDGSRAIERKEAIVDSTMVKIIARGHRWHRMLSDGAHPTIEDLAAAEKINPSYVSRVTRLAFLAPAIIETILEGKQPAHLTMKDLLAPFPADWQEQLRHFFASEVNLIGIRSKKIATQKVHEVGELQLALQREKSVHEGVASHP